jgi:hypothetical protein
MPARSSAILKVFVTIIGAFSEMLLRYLCYDACNASFVLCHSVITYYGGYL